MALSGNQITGIGAIGFSWQAYAPFLPKAESEPVVPPADVAPTGGGGFFFRQPRRTKEDILRERIRLGIIPEVPAPVIKAVIAASESVVSKQIKSEKPISQKAISEELRVELRQIGLSDILKKDIKRIYSEAIQIEMERRRIEQEEETALIMFMSIL